jgi:hypothetical protein
MPVEKLWATFGCRNPPMSLAHLLCKCASLSGGESQKMFFYRHLRLPASLQFGLYGMFLIEGEKSCIILEAMRTLDKY